MMSRKALGAHVKMVYIKWYTASNCLSVRTNPSFSCTLIIQAQRSSETFRGTSKNTCSHMAGGRRPHHHSQVIKHLFSAHQQQLTLDKNCRFCHTRFLWKGNQTLFPPPQLKTEKAVWLRETKEAPAMNNIDVLQRRLEAIEALLKIFSLYLKIFWLLGHQ